MELLIFLFLFSVFSITYHHQTHSSKEFDEKVDSADKAKRELRPIVSLTKDQSSDIRLKFKYSPLYREHILDLLKSDLNFAESNVNNLYNCNINILDCGLDDDIFINLYLSRSGKMLQESFDYGYRFCPSNDLLKVKLEIYKIIESNMSKYSGCKLMLSTDTMHSYLKFEKLNYRCDVNPTKYYLDKLLDCNGMPLYKTSLL